MTFFLSAPTVFKVWNVQEGGGTGCCRNKLFRNQILGLLLTSQGTGVLLHSGPLPTPSWPSLLDPKLQHTPDFITTETRWSMIVNDINNSTQCMMSSTCYLGHLIRLQNLEYEVKIWREYLDITTLTQLGLITLLLWPSPSCPHSLHPNVNNLPELVTTAVCWSEMRVWTKLIKIFFSIHLHNWFVWFDHSWSRTCWEHSLQTWIYQRWTLLQCWESLDHPWFNQSQASILFFLTNHRAVLSLPIT